MTHNGSWKVILEKVFKDPHCNPLTKKANETLQREILKLAQQFRTGTQVSYSPGSNVFFNMPSARLISAFNVKGALYLKLLTQCCKLLYHVLIYSS